MKDEVKLIKIKLIKFVLSFNLKAIKNLAKKIIEGKQ